MTAATFNELFGLASYSQDATERAFWPFQDSQASSASIDDISTNNKNLTLDGPGVISGLRIGDLVTTGPDGYQQSAIGFDGVSVYADVGWLGTYITNSFSFVMWIRITDSGDGNIWNIYSTPHTATVQNLYLNVDGTISLNIGGSSMTSSIAINDGEWHSVVVAGDWAGSGGAMYIDGVLRGTHTGGVVTLTYGDEALGVAATPNGLGLLRMDIAGFAWFGNRVLIWSEIDEWLSGPELVNGLTPSLSMFTTYWSATVGTWGLHSPYVSGSNGSPVYSWELRNAADDSVVESGTGSSPSGVGTYNGDYYLWVRATNSGGYDPAEDAISTTKTAVTPATYKLPDNRIRFPVTKVDLSTEVGLTGLAHDDYPAAGSQARADWMNLFLIGLLAQQASYEQPIEKRDGTPWFDLTTLSLKIWRNEEWQLYSEAIPLAEDDSSNVTTLADWFASVNDALSSLGTELVFSGVAKSSTYTINIPASLRESLYPDSRAIVYVNGLLVDPRTTLIDASSTYITLSTLTLTAQDEFTIFLRRISDSAFYIPTVTVP